MDVCKFGIWSLMFGYKELFACLRFSKTKVNAILPEDTVPTNISVRLLAQNPTFTRVHYVGIYFQVNVILVSVMFRSTTDH